MQPTGAGRHSPRSARAVRDVLHLCSSKILAGKLPRRSILRNCQARSLFVTDDPLFLGIKPDRAPKFQREQAELDRHVYMNVIVGIAARLLPGLDAVQPLAFMPGRGRDRFSGVEQFFILSPSATILNIS